MTERNPRLRNSYYGEVGPRTRFWLVRNRYFSWGHDAWIHEDDEGTVMSTLDAIDDCIRRLESADD